MPHLKLFPCPGPLSSALWRGLRVGLLGGSFNPPHEGHLHISMVAMQFLKLDAVWWLVTPDHPLKPMKGVPSIERRAEWCEELALHPRIVVTCIERELGTSITFDTVGALNRRFPGTQFCFITGMDNALSLHRWNRWRELLGQTCMVHVARPPALSLVKASPSRLLAPQKQIYLADSGRYPLRRGTTYWILQKKMVDMSSTYRRLAQAAAPLPEGPILAKICESA